MRIFYLSGVQHTLVLKESIQISSQPPNFHWETREALALAKLGHEVQLFTPYLAPRARISPDIVFCAADRQSEGAIDAGKKLQIPVVLQMISAPADYEDEIWDGIKAAMKKADGITCVAQVSYRGTKRWAAEADWKGPIGIVPHGVDLDLVDSVPQYEREAFVYVGALMGHKNVDVLIRAAARTGLPVIIVGDGPERYPLESLTRIYNAPVEFRGAVDERGKFIELKRAKALLTASKSEEFWIPGAEGLACNTPVICNHVQDVIDTYGDSLTYFKSFDELCELMQAYWMNPPLIDGRKEIEKMGLSLEARSRKLVDFFVEILRHG